MSKSLLYSQFKTSDNLEKTGVWLQYGEEGGKPVRIRIARAGGGNVAYRKALDKVTRPHKKAIQMETLSPEMNKKLLMEVYADTVILGWENINDENGEPMGFNRDNVMKLLGDLPDIFDDIVAQAQTMAIFRDEEKKADLGN